MLLRTTESTTEVGRGGSWERRGRRRELFLERLAQQIFQVVTNKLVELRRG